MILTQANIQDHILAVQCLQGEHAKTLLKGLNYGRQDTDCLVSANNQVTAYLRVLYEYEGFSAEPIFAWKFVFGKEDASSTITVTVGGVPYAVTNPLTATAEENAAFFFAGWLAAIPGIEANIIDNVVYLWGYTTGVIGTINANVGFEDITTDPNEILDVKNCLTHEEFCIITQAAYKQLPNELTNG